MQKINQVRICYEGNWRKKHLASIKTSYANAPYFRELLDVVEEMFSARFERLIDLNLMIIQYIKKNLRIDTPLILESDLGVSAKGNKLLIEICRKVRASNYLAQAATKKYLDSRLFADAGIELDFFRPPSPVYPQLWGDFIPDISAFDLLFNCGPKSHDILCGLNAK